MTSPSPATGNLDTVDDDFTDLEIAELQDEQPTGPLFTVPSGAPSANAEGHRHAEPIDGSEAAVELDEATAIAASLRTLATGLSGLDSAGLVDHVEYYQQAHGQLQQALRDIDHA